MTTIRNADDRPARDDELVAGLLHFANGGTFALEGRTPLADDTARRRYAALLATAASDQDKALADFFCLHSDSLRTMPLRALKLRPVLVPSGRGRALEWLRDFRSAADAADFAITLVFDRRRPYGAKLCQCRLLSCSRFYLAEKNPSGGPPNRNYCCSDHRVEANNRKLVPPRKPK